MTAITNYFDITLQLYEDYAHLLLLTSCRPNGDTFVVPKTDYSLPRKPQIGDIVTFTYDHKQYQHAPANPQVNRFRTDLSWKEIVANHLQEGMHSTISQGDANSL